jgi:hypothetical protein
MSNSMTGGSAIKMLKMPKTQTTPGGPNRKHPFNNQARAPIRANIHIDDNPIDNIKITIFVATIRTRRPS